MKVNKKIFKLLAAVLAIIILISTVAVIQLGVTANNGGDWDHKAYIPDENLVYPNQSIISGGWGWPATVKEMDGYLEFKYNQAVSLQYTAGITEFTIDGAHIKLAVENATHYYLGFGKKQQHPQTGNEIAFKLDKSADTFSVSIGSEIQVIQNFTCADDNLLDIKIEKTSSGYDFIFDGSFTYTLTNELLNSKNNLKNIFNTGKAWFNVSPNSTTPTFKIYSVHGGDQTCYDELSESYSVTQMNSIFPVIDAIDAIDSIITVESKEGIEAARTAYDELDEELKQYIVNYSNLIFAEDAYIAAVKADANIDAVLYEAEPLQVGPNRHWNANTVDWYKSATGIGTTIEFKSGITVHNVGLNSGKTIGLDGAHIRFGKGSYNGHLENFALIIDPSAQIDMTWSGRRMTLIFNITSTGLTVSAAAKGLSNVKIIETNLINKSNFENGWDILFKSMDDGSYTVTINGSVTGTISKNIIDTAVDAGLDLEKLNFTLGANNLGGATSGSLKVDLLSVHDKNSKCSDELYDEYGAEALSILKDAIQKINAVNLPITLESGLAIMTAEQAYEAVNDELKQYITKYDDLVTKRRIYDKLNSKNINVDPVSYPVDETNIGPTQYWNANKVDWYNAESGTGATIKFVDTTVHRVGLTVNKTLKLDGMHMQFANCTFTGQGEIFALLIDNGDQVAMDFNTKKLWLIFNVKDSNVTVSVNAPDVQSQNVINTTYITKNDMQNTWDFRLKKLENGDWQLTLNDLVDGIIPKKYIDAAVEAGLNLNSAKISLGAYNYGGAPGILQMDLISFHSGDAYCYSDVPEGDILATENCKNLINDIGEVTAESGTKIKAAQDAFDALGEYLQGMVSNANILREKSREYNLIATDVNAANKVDKLINALSDTITDDNYNDYLTAYFEYLDLFPRARKYVSNANALLKAVAKYEAENKGVNLANESMNMYTKGKSAHYLK